MSCNNAILQVRDSIDKLGDAIEDIVNQLHDFNKNVEHLFAETEEKHENWSHKVGD